MTFADLLEGDSVFVDANIFVYTFGPDPLFGPPSRALLERIESGNLKAYTSTHVFHDVAHRLMTLEACQTFGWPFSGIGQRLRRHPDEIHKLFRFRQALDEIIALGVRIISVSPDNVLLAGDLSRTHGVLSGDALILAVMQANNVANLASSDTDFDRAPNIKRYAPV
jgi:predicted nucleic acid-binding protein